MMTLACGVTITALGITPPFGPTLSVGADPILTHRADRKMTQGGALRF